MFLGEVNLGESALVETLGALSPMIWAKDWMVPEEDAVGVEGCCTVFDGRCDPDFRTALSLTKLPKDFLLSLMTTSSSSLGVCGGEVTERETEAAVEGKEGDEEARTGEAGNTAGRGGG